MSFEYGMGRHRDPWREEEENELRMQDLAAKKENAANRAQQKKEAQTSIQPKLQNDNQSIVSPDDASEKQADEVSQKVVEGKTVDISGISGNGGNTISPKSAGAETPSLPGNFNEGMGKSSGTPLNGSVKTEMESKMNADFGDVKIHTDSTAQGLAESINAKAFTSGQDIYFGKGNSPEDKSLLAHELVHTQQQAQGNTRQIMRQTKKSDPKAIIPVRDLIKYIKAVEAAYPDDDWQKVLTRIRQEYYNGFLFEKLIPTAPIRDDVPSYDAPWTTGDRRRRTMYLTDMEKVSGGKDAYQHLTAHADENSIQDNPSPYILLDNGEQIDLGHLLLGLDALIHPDTGIPYTTYSVPNIDPSTVVGDLGIAVVWMTTHEKTKTPHKDAPVKLSSPNLDQYYQMSAPEQDLLGDVDAFGLYQSIGKHNSTISREEQFTQKLSSLIEYYYLKKSENKYSVDKRWQSYMERSGWTYTYSGGKVSLHSNVRADLLKRVKYFSDLYDDGYYSAVESVTFWDDPTRRTWKHADAVVDKFLEFVRTNLEKEIKGTSAPIKPSGVVKNAVGAAATAVTKVAKASKFISANNVILTQKPSQYSTQKDNIYLDSGTTVEIIDYGNSESFNQVSEKYRWCKVKVTNGEYKGKTGWVSQMFIQ